MSLIGTNIIPYALWMTLQRATPKTPNTQFIIWNYEFFYSFHYYLKRQVFDFWLSVKYVLFHFVCVFSSTFQWIVNLCGIHKKWRLRVRKGILWLWFHLITNRHGNKLMSHLAIDVFFKTYSPFDVYLSRFLLTLRCYL